MLTYLDKKKVKKNVSDIFSYMFEIFLNFQKNINSFPFLLQCCIIDFQLQTFYEAKCKSCFFFQAGIAILKIWISPEALQKLYEEN